METLSWQTHEYIHTEKNTDWYWIVGAVTLSIALIAIILNNLIFGLLVVVSASVLTLYATRKPQIIDIKLTRLGVQINKTYYPYTNLQSFWVETQDQYPRVFFKSEKKLSPYIVVLMGNGNAEHIHLFLSDHLPEVQHTEPLLEKLLIYFGF